MRTKVRRCGLCLLPITAKNEVGICTRPTCKKVHRRIMYENRLSTFLPYAREQAKAYYWRNRERVLAARRQGRTRSSADQGEQGPVLPIPGDPTAPVGEAAQVVNRDVPGDPGAVCAG
jgi:hypothetical protein